MTPEEIATLVRLMRESFAPMFKVFDTRLSEIKGLLERDTQELFTRMRNVEQQVSIIQDRQVGKTPCDEHRKTCRDSLEDGIATVKTELSKRVTSKDVEEILSKDSNLKWIMEKRKMTNAVLVIVLAAAIMGILSFGLYLFDNVHVGPKPPVVIMEKQ